MSDEQESGGSDATNQILRRLYRLSRRHSAPPARLEKLPHPVGVFVFAAAERVVRVRDPLGGRESDGVPHCAGGEVGRLMGLAKESARHDL